MLQMVAYGVQLSDLAVSPPDVDDPGKIQPTVIDTIPSINLHDLTYSNHVDTNSKITDSQVDALLDDISLVMARQDVVSDVACCVVLGRTQPGQTFGSPGDGRDIITSSGEMSLVLNNSSGRIKVVDLITWCGSNGSNIIGCGATPGNGIALVRISGVASEGKLWAHEFGHNTGLFHAASGGFIMSPSISASNTRLSTNDCNRYHFPLSQAQAPTTTTGICEDDDGDVIVSSYDNCPDVANNGQQDADNDGVGDACDNCTALPNPDQANCDSDATGDACDPEIILPDPAENVLFFTEVQFGWDPISARKRIYRGVQSGVWSDNEELIGTLNAGDIFDDGDTPASGEFFTYDVRPFNSCGEGF